MKLRRYKPKEPSLPLTMRRFLDHLVECEGWTIADFVKVEQRTVKEAVRAGWALAVEEDDGGELTVAVITPLGRAAHRWGWSAHVNTQV